MKELITKSLFNAVYNCDISKDSDMLRYYNKINIYEFAFKCKEWALKNNYKIQSQINLSNEGHSHITKKNDDCWAKGFFENTEIEAIIKACEFILTKRNQNENK